MGVASARVEKKAFEDITFEYPIRYPNKNQEGGKSS